MVLAFVFFGVLMVAGFVARTSGNTELAFIGDAVMRLAGFFLIFFAVLVAFSALMG